jgi:hypothetical protein
MNSSNNILNSHNLLECIFRVSSEEDSSEFLRYLPVCKRWNEIGQRILGKLWEKLKQQANANHELKNIVNYINLVDEKEDCFNKKVLNSIKFNLLSGLLYNCSDVDHRKEKVTLCMEELKIIGSGRIHSSSRK